MADFYSGYATPPNGFAKYRLRLNVTVAAQDVASNTSTLNYVLSLEKDRSQTGFYAFPNRSFSVSINGSVVNSGSGTIPDAPWTGWSAWTLANGAITVSHDADGSKAVSVAGAYSGAAVSWAIGPVSLSSSMVLTNIPRATTPTVSPSPAAVGSVVTVTLPRASSSFTHNISWACGSQSGTVANGVGASTPFTVPDVMAQYPTRIMAPVVITAVTKNGSATLGSKQVTLFARAVPGPPEQPTAGPIPTSKQFDIRARVVEYTGSEWSARNQIAASSIQLVDPSSATATCTISLSQVNAVDFEDYSIIDVDIYDGTNWIFTDHRFVLSRVDGDETDPTRTSSYSGTEFIDYSLGFAYTQKDYEWKSASPGEIMTRLIIDAKARNWGPRVGRDFNTNETSLGEPWANSNIARKIGKGTPLSQVLAGLVSDGLAEYRPSYRNNQAFLTLLNPGTGSDYSALGASPVVNLAVATLTRAPRRSSMEKQLTRVTVVGDDKVQITREKSPFNANVFGQMEGWVAASGVETNAEARKIGDNALKDNRSPTSERTFEYSGQYAAPSLYPYYTFAPGDWVLIPDGDNTTRERISQVTIDKQVNESPSLTILTGDRILSGVASLAKRQSTQTGGSIPGGNQTSLPPIDSRIPEEPVVSSVTSVGYWDSDGAAKSSVTISWAPVTTALNGANISVGAYEVWWRLDGGAAEYAFRSLTDQTTIEMPGFDVFSNIEFRVRARSAAGIFGQFSEDQPHTTQAPNIPLAQPAAPVVTANALGVISIEWDGKIATAPAPRQLAFVRAEISLTLGGPYTPAGAPLLSAGAATVDPGQYREYFLRLRAVDRLGVEGTPSAVSSILTVDPGLITRVPEVTTGLAFTTDSQFTANGAFLEAWFDLSWNAVEVDTEGDPLVIAGYQVWGREFPETEAVLMATVEGVSGRVLVEPNSEWRIAVRAISSVGAAFGAFSDEVVAVADAAVPVLSAPTVPTLSSKLGVVTVNWNGLLVDGAPPRQFRGARAEVSAASTGPFTQVGPPFSSGGTVVTGKDVGATVFVRLVARDSLSVDSPASEIASIVVVGVGAGDIEVGAITLPNLDASISDAISGAQSDAAAAAAAASAAEASANGKSRVFRQAGAPAGTAHTVGDVWFDVDDDNSVYLWDGSAWTAAPFGTNAIAEASITNALIADATIQNAKIATLDAAKITTGLLSAGRISARSISTEKLLVANLTNLIEDPSFEADSAISWSTETSDVTKSTATPRSGDYCLRIVSTGTPYEASRHQTAIAVQPGEEYLLSGFARMGSGDATEGALELRMAYGATAGAMPDVDLVAPAPTVTTEYGSFSGVYIVPSGMFFIRPVVFMDDTVSGNVYLLDDVSMSRRSTGELIVDGAITSDQLSAESVTAEKIAALSVGADAIQAQAITAEKLAVGAITASSIEAGAITADAIEVGVIEAYHLSAAVGQSLDISSNESINLIVSNVADNVTALDGVVGTVQEMGTYYQFGNNEATISSPDSTYALALSPEGIQIRENNVAVSTWDAGQFLVESAVISTAVVGNHQIEKYETGTVVRAL